MRHSSHFVEELTARAETPVGKMVPLSAVEPNPDQPRSTMGDLTELANSIREKGILEPILVRGRESAPGTPKLQIISGERRFRAAMEAGLIEIPVIEMEVTEEEALEIALIENLQRKDLTPFEEAEGYRSLAERFDYTHEEISAAVGKSRTVVTESLALLQMPNRVRETAQALAIATKSLLLEVLKAEDEDEMIRLLEEVDRRGLSRDDLRRQKRGQKSAGSPRRKPFVFSFRPPDKSFNLSMKFRQSRVSKRELIQTLEEILQDLRGTAG
ncbi:MAG: ParB/RepB/Spo0J family partition protein [bacterium]|nr:ParB/RepB/Spo0J family partition protein [bacterium]